MRILVVGSGGREHAMVWKIAQSPKVKKIFCAPGNAGTAGLATNVPIGAEKIDELVAFAKEERIDLTVVGPEVPLTMGLADRFESEGLAVFGPGKLGAQLEGSKTFTKDLLARKGVPTAKYKTFEDPEEAKAYAREMGAPLVIKADGLAAGKGVLICQTLAEAESAIDEVMVDKKYGSAGTKCVVEEMLTGEEASFIAFTDGKKILPLAPSQDHKRAFDDDQGLNTGGMGAYSPCPVVDDEMYRKIVEQVLIPTLEGLNEMGIDFRGILYAGLMIKDGVPSVLEYNVRFGDPECQPLMARMKSDIVPVLEACAGGQLGDLAIEWDPRPAVCVVMAAGGYPESYDKGIPISGLDEAAGMEDVVVFHAGTKLSDNQVVTSGGRVLGVTALGADVRGAIERAYEACDKIKWDKVHYRRDIGRRALDRE